MRQSMLFAILVLCATTTSHAGGPTENISVRSANAYGSDDKWWKCNLDTAKGCETGPLDKLGLTPEERAFARSTLDRIPWHPKKASLQEVASVLGGVFREGLVTQTFKGVGPGADPGRGVKVYYLKGYVSMIHWFQPGRFLLVKQHPDPY